MVHAEGPDFICIGMPRAGTGWLYDQLLQHPDFWMPPIKEIRYLDREVPALKGAAKRLERGSARTGEKGQRRLFALRDRDFLERAAALGGQPMDVRQYANMFRSKGELLTGDVTPSYSTLSESVIDQIATHLPQVKIVLLIRDPVSRTWSYLSRRHRAGRFKEGLLNDPERFRTFLEGANNVETRSRPSKIIERWARIAPKVPFRYFFFDDLVKRPDWIRREILSYLGADSEKQSGELPADYNRKASAEKLELTPPIRAVLVEHFGEELRACGKAFGGAAEEWPARYGL
jgi:Sulfotransferase family